MIGIVEFRNCRIAELKMILNGREIDDLEFNS